MYLSANIKLFLEMFIFDAFQQNITFVMNVNAPQHDDWV